MSISQAEQDHLSRMGLTIKSSKPLPSGGMLHYCEGTGGGMIIQRLGKDHERAAELQAELQRLDEEESGSPAESR